MTPEGKIQKRAIDYAKKRGCKVRRNQMGRGAETGWPDVEFFPGGGLVLFIEFKAPGGKLSPRQAYLIEQQTKKGYAAHVCDDFEDAKNLIDEWVDKASQAVLS